MTGHDCDPILGQNAFERIANANNGGQEAAIRAQASDAARGRIEAQGGLITPYRLIVQVASYTNRVTGQVVRETTVVSPDFNNEPVGVWTGDGRNGTQGTPEEYQAMISRASRFAQIEGDASMVWVSPGKDIDGIDTPHRAYLWNKRGNDIIAYPISLTGSQNTLLGMMKKLGDDNTQILLADKTIIKDKQIGVKDVFDAYVSSLSADERQQNQRFIGQLQQEVELPDSVRQNRIICDQLRYERQLQEIYLRDSSQIGQAVESMVRMGLRLNPAPFAGSELLRGRPWFIHDSLYFLHSNSLPIVNQVAFLPITSTLNFSPILPVIGESVRTLGKIDKPQVLEPSVAIKPMEVMEPEKPKQLRQTTVSKRWHLVQGATLSQAKTLRVESGVSERVFSRRQILISTKKGFSLPETAKIVGTVKSAQPEGEKGQNKQKTRLLGRKREPSVSLGLAAAIYGLPRLIGDEKASMRTRVLPKPDQPIKQTEKLTNHQKEERPEQVTAGEIAKIKTRQLKSEIIAHPQIQTASKSNERIKFEISQITSQATEVFSQPQPQLKASLRKERKPERPDKTVTLKREVKEKKVSILAGFESKKTTSSVSTIAESVVFTSVSRLKPVSQEKGVDFSQPKEKLTKPKIVEKKPAVASEKPEKNQQESLITESGESQEINWDLFLRPVVVVETAEVNPFKDLRLGEPKKSEKINVEIRSMFPVFWEVEPKSEPTQGVKSAVSVFSSFYLALIYSVFNKKLIPIVLYWLKIVSIYVIKNETGQLPNNIIFSFSEPCFKATLY